MTTEPVQMIPEGMVLDFVDGKLRRLTPEEYVRQNIERSLVREYKYDKGDLAVEFPIKLGQKRKKVDIAVFLPAKPHLQENAYILVEAKEEKVSPNDKGEGVEQLKSYMAACVNCRYGMWTNGLERQCFEKETTTFEYRFREVIDIPIKGMTLAESERPTLKELKPATADNLLYTFKRCHNYIYGNQGLQKAEAFWELLKLIFCKIEDERSGQITFFVMSEEAQSMNNQLKVKARVDRLFELVKQKYPTIFKPNETIELNPRVLTYLVGQLQGYYLLETDVDVKGKAYEEIVGPNLRGDRGEFFTPRNVCRMAVEMLDPEPEDTILDPACGTGGFLIAAMNLVLNKIDEAEKRRWRDPEDPSDSEREELYRKRQTYMNAKVFGIDINPNLVKASKMNMVMNSDGSGGLYAADTLEHPARWSGDLRKAVSLGEVGVLFTNPPFGSKVPVAEPRILEQYEIAHRWQEVSKGRWVIRPGSLRTSVPPEQLFIERCVRFLKPGTGRMAMVVPDSILSNPELTYIRYWILRNAQILASIDLPTETFLPWTGTQTSLLVLRRKHPEEIRQEELTSQQRGYEIFMAIVERVGHDRRGNAIYRRDPEGNEVVVEQEALLKEVDDRGRLIVRRVRERQKLPDDQLPRVAQLYLMWAKEKGYGRFDAIGTT